MENNDNKTAMITVPTLKRLPLYYHFLEKKKATGAKYISCTTIAKKFHFVPILVRKDLHMTGAEGKPRIGYDIDEVLSQIGNVLGYNNTTDAFLVGVGNLGKALLNFKGFSANGLRIVGAFDIDKNLIGKTIGGIKVFNVDELSTLIRRMNIQIGIITTNEDSADSISQIMTDSGIKGIWSFAPGRLNVPEDVNVKYENLAVSLSLLKVGLLHK